MFSRASRLISFRRFFGQDLDGSSAAAPAMTGAGNTRVYFVATIVLYALFMALVEGRWVFGGQMWAEMATNYYPTAGHPEWLPRLFATDAGYIPIVPRLIALLGHLLRLEPEVIPYYYTWTALLLTGAIVGAFCLAPFRPLLRSDAARFLVGLIILTVADFETRTFINFTYFGTFLLAALMALAMRPEARTVSPWMWVALLLTLSKPYMFSVAPLAVLALMVATPRFRVLAGLTLALIGVQITRLAISASQGEMASRAGLGLPEKAWSAVTHAAGEMTGYLAGPLIAGPLSETPWILVALGAVLLAMLGLAIIAWRRHAASVLILTGVTLIAGTAALNSFAISAMWLPDLRQLHGLPLYRHTVTLVFGAVFLVVGFASALSDLVEKRGGNGSRAALMLVAIWAMVSGWPGKGIVFSQVPGFPITGAGAWQQAARAIAVNHPTLCVPIDPFPWVHGPGCQVLASPRLEFQWIAMEDGERAAFAFDPPPALAGKTLRSIVLYLRQDGLLTRSIDAALTVRTRDGRDVVLRRRVDVPNTGTSVLFEAPATGIADVSGLQLGTDAPVVILGQRQSDGNGLEPAAVWVGQ